MRKAFLSVLFIACTLLAQSQVKFENLSFSPQFPKQGDKLSFEFNAAASALSSEKKVDIAIYLFSSKGLKVLEPPINQDGKHYTGSITLDSNTNCIAFGFSAAEEKDNNFGKGFIVPVYNNSNQPVLEYYISAAQLYGGYGEYLFAMPNDPAKNLATLEEALKLYPDAKNNNSFLNAYLFSINTIKKKEAEPIITAQLKDIEGKADLKETDYQFLTNWYSRLKKKNVADSFTALMKKKYPDGDWKKWGRLDLIFAEKDPVKKEKLLEDFLKTNTLKEEEKGYIDNTRSQIAGAYGEAKNYEAFTRVAATLEPARRYSLYNELAWNMAEANQDIDQAKKMAKEATEWTQHEASAPSIKKPDNITQKAWENQRKSTYSMYADTYAFILYNTGAYTEGLPFAKDAATIAELKDAELNERYAMLLAKAAPAIEAQKIIEQMVSDGKATEKTKAALKEVYAKENKSDAGYETYLADLEKAAVKNKAEEVAKSMISEPAPNFKLKDFEGKEVSLEALKGKVVVVDFWATWCGPCIASMPAMKKAEDKLMPRGDVVFLFIDTWETAENKKKNAMDFMKKKNYPFHVLMDDDNKVVGDFGVTGIPAKFVIDKTGKIRFKATGFGGSADSLVDELSVMVDLASK